VPSEAFHEFIECKFRASVQGCTVGN